jgi:hypothetical protein
MTIPPRWSELTEEPWEREASVNIYVCPTCTDDPHVCSMTQGCQCCGATQQQIASEGNPNRLAYRIAADGIDGLAGPDARTEGDELDWANGGFSQVNAGVLNDMQPKAPAGMPAQPPSTTTPPPMPAMTDGLSAGAPASITDPAPPAAAGAAGGVISSSWNADTYRSIFQKQASDSDVYYQGYNDAISGKKMDEGLANLSMDYYQGYKQGLIYNESSLTSVRPTIEHIEEPSLYGQKTNSHPDYMDHNDLRSMSDLPHVASTWVDDDLDDYFEFTANRDHVFCEVCGKGIPHMNRYDNNEYQFICPECAQDGNAYEGDELYGLAEHCPKCGDVLDPYGVHYYDQDCAYNPQDDKRFTLGSSQGLDDLIRMMDIDGESLEVVLFHDQEHDDWHRSHGDKPCKNKQDCADKRARYTD